MAPPNEDTAGTAKPPLDLNRVLQGAVALADELGMEGFTIRKLATAIEVKPMTIYHYVSSKEAIIDGMVDHVFAEIELPPSGADWKEAMRHRARSARAVLARHPWATPLMESRTNPGPATLGHHDAVLRCLRQAGFSVEMTGHAYALIDAYIYGFALQEVNLPAVSGEDMAELAEMMTQQFPVGKYPHLVELTTQHVLKPGYDFGNEFEFGLSLILDGLGSANEPGCASGGAQSVTWSDLGPIDEPAIQRSSPSVT